MAQDYIGLGNARLRSWGLTPYKISTSSETRVPGRATFRGMDYQRTGKGDKKTTITAKTIPHVTKGMDMVSWLILHHDRQDIINYTRLGPNYLGQLVGQVIITNLDIDEKQIHPFTGIGRKIECNFELLHIGDDIHSTAAIAHKIWSQLNV